jgi:hypothetical protein
VLAVALAEAVLQQCRTTALVPMQSFDTDERQVPMGLGRPIMFRLLEDGSDFGLLLPDYTSCNNRRERPIIAMNTRWEPERDPEAVVGALRCSCVKRARSEGSE